MNDIEVFDKLSEITTSSQISFLFGEDMEKANMLAEHKTWLQSIRHERPLTAKHYNVGVYIRFFNQTKYDNYLEFHKQQFIDTLALCPNWNLVDIYIDEGATAPNMETAPGWSRLLLDCMAEKIDLIITQKVSNVSKKPHEVALCARLLATQKHPIGIYFISEDIFTLASYYQNDLRDTCFFPSNDWKQLPDDSEKDVADD